MSVEGLMPTRHNRPYEIISEMSLYRQSITMVTTESTETKHCIHPKHKTETEKLPSLTKQTVHPDLVPHEQALFLQFHSQHGAIAPAYQAETKLHYFDLLRIGGVTCRLGFVDVVNLIWLSTARCC